MQELQGNIDSILFQSNKDGYVVAKFKEKVKCRCITIVGYIPYITEGESLKLNGEWITHPHFGRQFKVETCEQIVPDSKLGIERYLSSGVISGIGPVTARKIVEKFGENTLEVLDSDIGKLREIEGIGEKKIQLICNSYSKQNEIRNLIIFFQNYGIKVNQCVKIHKQFGNDSIRIVKGNPYILTEKIPGIGFKTADKIARSTGIQLNSPFRIQSGVNYIINNFCGLGNTYMPFDQLVNKSIEFLGVSRKEIEENIYENSANGKIKLEDANGRICAFTLPYYYCEMNVTRKILSLVLTKYEDIKIDVNVEIEKFERDHGVEFASSQKEAINGAFKNGVEIITGGPGTGKTTIINAIAQIFEEINYKVFMAAPTGRAAKRMSEATGREAKTIHRLLEMGINENQDDALYSRGEGTPLECDVLIIDEASMIDIILMSNLLKAISIGTRLIIVGDADQLPSVGPGNVLRDLIESKCVKIVRLKEIFRQSRESLIVVNAHKINNGEMPLLNKKDKDFYFIRCSEPENILNTLIQLVDKRLPNFNKTWDKMKHIQVLSPMRKGILGVNNLNLKLQEILNAKSKMKKEKEFRDITFRVGDKVMQIKNNYSLKWTRVSGNGEHEGVGVFNGDVGYIDDIDDDKNTISVIFDNEKRVIYDNLCFDELELAYAMTIHKSQGSEFPVGIMPVFMGPPLLMNRNLLYTAITRAKQMVVLVGNLRALKFMISNDKSFERYSLLKYRIMDIMESGLDANVPETEFEQTEK
ncbi:ATP-dependent RecD-like DNA helicase [Clostridium fermenticellae]|uniref:ATP-dependent RecD2 DNA helicase n=1 Tax=Clostridium fermenticellae TaxID=2068654 RepID=A0A386H0N1_9CLOT|nr:ATP-dependent RecD-like DNA helicase [Clostridium fermenticellae]AYD39214.1 ATP-dependent RecD-like DNA helicase [Clostridium fermenticellae]